MAAAGPACRQAGCNGRPGQKLKNLIVVESPK